MSFKRIAIGLVFVIAVMALAGCGGRASAPTPSPEKGSTQQEKPKGQDLAKDYGEKDWLASATFAEYIDKAREKKTENWYHCLAAIPEIRKGTKGRVGIIVADFTPSEKDKMKEVLSFYTEIALGCPDPKIVKVVILDKKGNVLVEKENK